MRCSNEDFENFLTNKIPYNNQWKFLFFKKIIEKLQYK